ncbi:MAG: FprA family A-type flavoprotein [Cyanobacteriota bacterium]
MNDYFKALKITDNIYWVGAIDWQIRNFHGYNTSRGTTYNAYLVIDDKITLIDTVKKPFKDEFLSRIDSIIDPADIDYVISNHSEMDHSGLLPEIIDIAKPEKVIASNMGIKALHSHFHNLNYNIHAVKDGEVLNTGKYNINFFETRMLHWPDSMISYLAEEQILFSNDIFGMHLASLNIFDDEIEDYILFNESAKYFANIILPYSTFVSKAMHKLRSSNLELKYIATDHGPIWRKHISKILDLYEKWPLQEPTLKAVLIYHTMWGSTEKMSDAIAEGLASENIDVNVMPLNVSHRSDIATEVLDAGAIIFGTSVLNGNIFPASSDVLNYLNGLKPKNIIGFGFGSYGWSKSALDNLTTTLANDIGIELVGETIMSNYVPDKEILTKCYDQGVLVGKKLKEKCNETLEMRSMRIHS